ncbi:hypothetical protein CIHG_01700 [Coccidioides immitis H538.4]|uniref:Uncharacterized protein n=3 Tax=Coccidioides immitis TaxID=5501 RepID=A0A0J8R9H0_COCIT|nr:hypothetical protein CIRG_06029 [Coccidioides immitis RMSCC 2394]KMU80448.1 hypothetical protein CISG_02299 [Coccidioides immitis RMSCC 3703]KMU83916.1 hypothetical protein CIHG_01700 [Coccidioides immitis H538.4]
MSLKAEKHYMVNPQSPRYWMQSDGVLSGKPGIVSEPPYTFNSVIEGLVGAVLGIFRKLFPSYPDKSWDFRETTEYEVNRKLRSRQSSYLFTLTPRFLSPWLLMYFVQNLKRPWHFYHFYLEPDSLSTFGSAIFTRDKDHATLYTNYRTPLVVKACESGDVIEGWVVLLDMSWFKQR